MVFEISNLPIIATILFITIVGLLLLIFALSKTKPATSEARLGRFEFVFLPAGKRLSGLLTTAKKLVSEEWTYELARTKTITREQAKKLQENFNKLFFYGLRSGHSKHLIISSVNLESPDYAIPTSQVFEFPFGFVSKRIVVCTAEESERAGWKVAVINPRNLTSNELSPEVFEKMTDIGDAAAAVKQAAILVKKDLPWKEIALARERQLKATQDKYAEVCGQLEEVRMGLAKPSLLEAPGEEKGLPTVPTTKKTLPWGRIIVSLIAFGVASMIASNLKPIYFPKTDPLIPSLVVVAVVFLVYPTAKKYLKRWF